LQQLEAAVEMDAVGSATANSGSLEAVHAPLGERQTGFVGTPMPGKRRMAMPGGAEGGKRQGERGLDGYSK
jgi:hypothetical protein